MSDRSPVTERTPEEIAEAAYNDARAAGMAQLGITTDEEASAQMVLFPTWEEAGSGIQAIWVDSVRKFLAGRPAAEGIDDAAAAGAAQAD